MLVVIGTDIGGNGPAISNISPRVGFVCSPLHSRALIPKREVKKDRGRNLGLLELCIIEIIERIWRLTQH
jgi:hypothetical protein